MKTIFAQMRADLIFADPPYFLSNGGITCHVGKMVLVNKGEWNHLTSVDQIHEFNIQGKLSVHVASASSPIKCRIATR